MMSAADVIVMDGTADGYCRRWAPMHVHHVALGDSACGSARAAVWCASPGCAPPVHWGVTVSAKRILFGTGRRKAMSFRGGTQRYVCMKEFAGYHSQQLLQRARCRARDGQANRRRTKRRHRRGARQQAWPQSMHRQAPEFPHARQEDSGKGPSCASAKSSQRHSRNDRLTAHAEHP